MDTSSLGPLLSTRKPRVICRRLRNSELTEDESGSQVGCPGCSLIATRDFSTWTTNRRLALLGRYRDWSTDATLAERIFRLSDVVLCTSNSCHAGKKVRRVEQKCVDCGKRGKHAKKVVYIEEWEAGWMYIKLVSLLLSGCVATLPSLRG